jgi:hypothetical protein
VSGKNRSEYKYSRLDLISGVHARKIKKNTRLQLPRVEAMLHQIADAMLSQLRRRQNRASQ